MNDALLFLVRLFGAFYIFTGFIVLKMMLLDRVMDGLLTVLEGKPRSPRETTRRVMLTSIACLTGLSGAALAALSLWAVPLFLASLVMQIMWLLWARKNYAPEDAAEAAGRERTRNAAILYGAFTLGVLLLAARGYLLPWLAPLPLAVMAGVALTGAVYAYRSRAENKGNGLETLADPDIDYPPPAPPDAQPKRVCIHPKIGAWIEVASVSAADLSLPPPAEDSATVALRVAKARHAQRARFDGRCIRTNAEAEGELLDAVATPDEDGRTLLTTAAEKMKLTARGYHRVLRVARTIADLAGAETVARPHVAEALSYRRIGFLTA